ncbi:MAG: OsmC family protein [Steroidobacteraceae bacterium]|nr:OsmC family protein [Steroidobacteraceae bacterium]
MQRKASAAWEGGIRDGKGTISTESRVLVSTPYSFGTRFESAPGTNPEELLAAAHAGCFSMALSLMLGEAGIRPERIDTTATVTLEKLDTGFTITRVHLDVAVRAAGAERVKFEEAAQKAKAGCPLSKVLRAEITMDAKLAA